MLQVSRDNSLKIPKKIEIHKNIANTPSDAIATKIGIATANNKKINKKELTEQAKEFDKELDQILKIPTNSNDLLVITVVKKLGAYIIDVTEKSPKKFRGVFDLPLNCIIIVLCSQVNPTLIHEDIYSLTAHITGE